MSATVERRGGRWIVVMHDAIVGRHSAKFRAIEQATRLNGDLDPCRPSCAARKAPHHECVCAELDAMERGER